MGWKCRSRQCKQQPSQLFYRKIAEDIDANVGNQCSIPDEGRLVVHEGAINGPHSGYHIGHARHEEAWRTRHRAPHVPGNFSYNTQIETK